MCIYSQLNSEKTTQFKNKQRKDISPKEIYKWSVSTWKDAQIISSSSLVTKLCPILVTPQTVACQASLSMEFSREEYWSGLPFPSPAQYHSVQFSSVQSLSRVQLFVTPWIAACQASLSIANSRNSIKLTSIESVMPSSHLILCHPLLLLPPIPPSFRVFSNESTLRMR